MYKPIEMKNKSYNHKIEIIPITIKVLYSLAINLEDSFYNKHNCKELVDISLNIRKFRGLALESHSHDNNIEYNTKNNKRVELC